jgi:hypothetical protein
MGNDYKAVDRHIWYLQQEIYNYDKFLRHPVGEVDMATQAKFAADADDNVKLLEELMTLRELADKAKQPTGIATWQAALMATFSGIALAVAVASIYLVLYVH